MTNLRLTHRRRRRDMTNRYVCSALEELRTQLEKHFTFVDVLVPEASNEEYHMSRRQLHIEGLIEEIQTYVNRMEASLGDKWDMHWDQDRRTKVKKSRRAAEKKLDKLEAKIEKAEEKLKEMEGKEDGEDSEE